MKLKNIFAAIISGAMAISAMAFSASAAESIDVKLYGQDTSEWVLLESSDTLTITGDGSYSITADFKGYDLFATLYIKEVNGAKAPDDYAGAKFNLESIVINDNLTLDMSKTEYDLLGESSGVLDVCFLNQWAETFVNNAVKNGDSYNYTDSSGKPVAVNTITVKFNVTGVAGSAADTAAVPEANTVSDANTSTDVAAPASDLTTSSATTGNIPAAAVITVMLIAGTAAVVSKKKK